MRMTPMHVTQWKEPALAWNGSVAEDGRASILEIRSDDFLPEFLGAMAGADPAAYYFDHRLAPKGSAPLKLYQPLHGRFYLVAASLVCRQVGLPDKAIDRAGGESAFFVIRRRTAAGEEGWIAVDKGGYWLPLAQDAVLSVAPGEERLPLHPVQIQPRPAVPRSVFTDNLSRDLLYGYIPAGNRSKYRDTLRRTLPGASGGASGGAPSGAPGALDPQTLVNNFIKDAEAHAPPGQTLSWRKEVFYRRVFRPWTSLSTNLSGDPPRLKVEISTNAQTEQLYALLELADFFKTYLPTLWAALVAGKGDGLAANSSLLKLYQRLTDSGAAGAFKIRNSGSDQMLGAALVAFRDYIELVRGQGAIPATNLNLGPFLTAATLAALQSAVEAAIGEEKQPIPVSGGADNELVRLITDQVQPREAEGKEATYHIRVAYVYDPECPPLVSPAASHPFQLAAYFDPDAPARLIKIEAPSIKPADLRKYARGVGVEMSPELHKLSSCMSGEKLDDIVQSIGSCSGGGLSIRMICTFSIQIIFLVAFIVMFTFLIMLNFVFGWLAYLRICLPIPVKE